MVFGKLFFGFVLGNIASTLANAEIRRVKYEEKLGAIQVRYVSAAGFCKRFSIFPKFLRYNQELITAAVCYISGAYVRSKYSRDSAKSGDELLRIYLE